MPPLTPSSTAAPAPAAVPLTAVPVGSLATLHEVRDAASRPVLRSLGLTDACVLRLCQVGDPCIVQVRSTRIGLSRDVAHALYVVTHVADAR
jgi:Fe2+ transport system protein FeoA